MVRVWRGWSFRRRLWPAMPLLGILAVAVVGCGPPASACIIPGHLSPAPPSNTEAPISQTSPQVAALATRYEPTVMMSALDRFWPVSVAKVLAERNLSAGVVRLVSRGHASPDPATLADLKPSDLRTSYLDFPALLSDKAAQMRVFLRGLGVPESRIDSWPADLSPVAQRTAQIYFYDAGSQCSYEGPGTRGYRALQYWFFYAFNYYPMTIDTVTMLAHPLAADTADVDFHEGDWEHVTLLLQPQGTTYVPKFVWMARHAKEGVLIPWDQIEQDSAGHPIVYPAFGGHPSYPSCGAHPRALLAAAVYDYVPCGARLYRLSAASTPLVDLAHVSWSCWPGHFGTTVGTTGSGDADDPSGQILVAGPASPLQQAEDKGVCP